MRVDAALGLLLVLLAVATSAGAQPGAGRPAVTPAAPGATLSDVQRQFDSQEQSLEQQYAKLMQGVKNSKAALADKIKALDESIDALKTQASKIQLIAQKTEQLLPNILAAKGPARSTGRLDDLGTVLSTELSKAGVSASPDELRWVVEAIGKGGPGAGSRVSAQAAARIERTNAAIKSTQQKIAELQGEIKTLDEQLAKLEKDRDKGLAELKKQRQRAIEDAGKRRESTVERAAPKP